MKKNIITFVVFVIIGAIMIIDFPTWVYIVVFVLSLTYLDFKSTSEIEVINIKLEDKINLIQDVGRHNSIRLTHTDDDIKKLKSKISKLESELKRIKVG